MSNSNNRFSPGFPGELLPLEFDFSKALNQGETLVGPATVTVAAIAGTDANPSAIVAGALTLNGSVVTFDAAPAVGKVDYRFWVRCPTSNPHKVLVCEGLLYING